MFMEVNYTSEEKTKDLTEKTGSFNEFPPRWRKMTVAEFAKSHFFGRTPKFIETRQMHGKKHVQDAVLYHYSDGTGIGMVSDFWGGRISYYHFGCNHSYRELSQKECQDRGIYHAGRCWHVHECKECGNVEAHDSSD